jgi:hypothetical protein
MIYIPCNAASRPTVIDKDQPIKSLGSISRDKVSTTRLHLKMVFAHGPTLVGRQCCIGLSHKSDPRGSVGTCTTRTGGHTAPY